ncbi:hypothetical protein PLICRDRAFT_409015 [Plicaturopsis crispa FD-325 SS-3]|nr:hypothetical protein PLICRDRAFT_409015 [Plicaturopsis crispa FD-325 SS-3]
MSSSLKLSTSTRMTRLRSRTSQYNASVTLFEQDDAAGPSTPRRTKRIKLEDVAQGVPDPEDAIPDVSSSGGSLKRKTPAKAAPESKPKVAKTRKVKAIPQFLENPHPAPVKWKETYDTIKKQRSRIVAPVDTMGCDQAHAKESDPKSQRFSTLVSLMLSSQTKDEVTDAAVKKLRAAVGGTLNVDAIIAADEGTISEAIAKVGFWRRKTQYIKQTAQKLHDDFDSDVPKTVDELNSLPGVGPKMAFLALQVAWNLNLGIGVDVHVHRITNRLGWHKRPTKDPEETRLNLQSWLPKELHPEINHMLVGFGQTICLPVGPRCDLCDLSSTGLCPSVQKVTNAKGRKSPTKSPTKPAGPKIEIDLDAGGEGPAVSKGDIDELPVLRP